MLKILLISIVLVAIAMIGFAFNILFRKKGQFPTFHIGENDEMKKKGITCAKCEDMGSCSIIDSIKKQN